MRALRAWFLRLTHLFGKRRRDRDFQAELDAHLALHVADNVRAGVPPDQARRRALMALGGIEQTKEQHRDRQGFRCLEELLQDVRVAARSLMKYPIAALVAIVSLAGGVGATTATLAIRDVVFLKPPSLYRNPAELSRVQVGSPEHPIMPVGNPVPGKLFAVWRHAMPGAQLAGVAPARVREARTTGRSSSTVRVRSVTPDFFSVLGVDPIIGGPSRERVPSAVLSHQLWQTLFGGRADAIGSIIWIDNQPFSVTGVMPERFWFSTMDAPIWLPVSGDALSSEPGVEVIVRRQSGISPDKLAEQLQHGLSEYGSALPASERQLRLKVSGIEGTPLARSLPLALPWLLGMSVLLTLLIACANVAILVIAQWTAREHEIAIRASLGASRGRIIRTLMTESVVIAGIGGLLGVCVTLALTGVIAHRAGGAMRLFDLSIDPRILLESLVVTVLTGVISGIGPALLETRRLHGNPMRALSSSDRVRQRWRHALVVIEIAITVALLVATGGMLSVYERQLVRDVGFSTHPLVTLQVENDAGVPVERIVDAASRIPGVDSIAPSTSVPYAASGPLERVSADANGSGSMRAERAAIGLGFFTTLNVPLRAGRMFTAADSSGTHTAIVNEVLAARLFAGRDPVGQHLWLRGSAYEIVGVVAQYVNAALQSHERDPKLYLPFEGNVSARNVAFLVRASSDPSALVNVLRQEVRNFAPGTAVSSVHAVDEMVSASGQEILVGTAPLLPLIAIGMLLTGAGIYGVLAFAVARRSRELAVRIAIGSTPRQLLRLVMGQSLRLIAIGAGCGVAVQFALSRIVRASGGEGSFMDPAWPAFVIPVAIIVIIGAAATWAPSRRALRINPATLLRAQ